MRALNFLLTALSVTSSFLTFGSANPLVKRATQVSLISQSYSGSTLSGTVRVQNIAYAKVLTITWANGNNWNSANVINGYYISGPDSSGYEVWGFSGSAPSATQFYITYRVNNVNYYDPGNNVNYQISTQTTSTPPGSTSTFVPVQGLDEWLLTESSFAQNALLKNIGSSNNTIVGPGVIIASPSTSSPDYFYQWTRDGSIVMEHLVNEYLSNGAYLSYIKDWITVQAILQRVNNPSGGYTTGGLGEPKFRVDNTAYTGSWGRPQRDGPALRAITLIKFANTYISTDRSYITNTVWPVIKADLDYVASSWNQGGFDLWEELSGTHFFTTIVQYRSLIDGAAFATLLGDTNSKNTYTAPQANIASTLQSFWNSGKNYLIAMLNTGRSGIDCGTLLGSLKGGNYLFSPSNSKVLATLHGLISAFENLYNINKISRVGNAIGRYPEDIYDGVGTSQAHPWFICTTTSAHTIYRALGEFLDAGAVTIDSTSLGLFRRFDSTAAAGTYSLSTSTGQQLITGLFSYADTFLGVVKQYAKPEGNLSEQFNRNNGQQEGARDLTWSYESLLEAIKARNIIKSRISSSSSTTTTTTSTTSTTSATYATTTSATYATTTSGYSCVATATVTVTVTVSA
ncbi:Glucoamylase [Dactylella cylindrospora]|nr:Glucoamylase [Dactylella cylindrospora]